MKRAWYRLCFAVLAGAALCSQTYVTVAAAPSPVGTLAKDSHDLRRLAPLAALADLGIGPWSFRSSTTPSAPYAFQTVTPSGLPGRWDPCVPVSWRLYKPGSPKGVLALLKKDFKKLSAATGLVFEYKGYAPRSAVEAGRENITIAFMPRSGMLTSDEAKDASGTASVSGFELADGRVVYTGATVTFLRSRFSARSKVSVWEPLILHELGHVVGLDHVDDPKQIMYPYERSFRSYQSGDLAGLKLLGRDAGCNSIGL